MLDLLGAEGTLPFSVALALMLLLALLEGVGMLLGAGLSSLIDSLLPDIDLDVDGPDVQSPGPLSALLGWLYIGRVPFLVVLVLGLTFFGISGLVLQSTLQAATGRMLPAWLASIPALGLALPLTRWSASTLARVLPRDETEAVSADSFVGRIATITLGTARPGSPAQARLRDQYGQTHYVLVEPHGEEPLVQGTQVLLVEQRGSRFAAIVNPNPALTEHDPGH